MVGGVTPDLNEGLIHVFFFGGFDLIEIAKLFFTI